MNNLRQAAEAVIHAWEGRSLCRWHMNALHTALTAPQPEPVAEVTEVDLHADHQGPIEAFAFLPIGTKLYAAPQAQQPLTDEQIDAIPCTDGDGSDRDALMRFARAIERAHGIGKP